MELQLVFEFSDRLLAEAVNAAIAPDNAGVPQGQQISQKLIGERIEIRLNGEPNESLLYTVEDIFEKELLCIQTIRALQQC